jgi:ethanolamine utilization microcompartment shell protein EutS
MAALLSVLVIALPGTAGAQAPTPADSQRRARFLLNFLRFTEWPQSAFDPGRRPLNLCVLGLADPFAGALAELHGSTASGHQITVRNNVPANQAEECHLLYVPDVELHHLSGAREAIGQRPILVVGESEAVFEHGGMIALRNLDQRLGFVVHLAPARRASLRFSPQMLNAAVEVLP